MSNEPVIKTSKHISPGELAVGQFVTVLNPTVREIHQPVNHPSYGVVLEKVKSEDFSSMGDALEVLAICLPYVVVLRHPIDRFSRPNRIDTRITSLMELSTEYVNALTGKRNSGNV